MWTFLFYQNFPWFLDNLSYTTFQWKISFFYFFYTQMKKSIFLLGLLTIAGISLTACGSKSYEMPFDEALEIASHSALQDILSNNENVQQNFDITTSFDSAGTNIAANIETSSKENTKTNESEASIKFDVDTNSEENGNIKLNWKLDIKLVDGLLFLNLNSLDVTWPEEVSLIAWIVDWIKNKWLSTPMEKLGDMSNWYLKDVSEINTQAKEIFNNEGFMIYNWKFSQFEWYNAWKISLNNEKLQEILDNYFKSMNTIEDEGIETPKINVENFEWYLVITWKDKVTVVVDNMDIVDEESSISANWFGGEDYLLNMWAEWEDIITLTANKKRSNYDVTLNINDLMSLNWTITPKVSDSSINIKFDAKLIVKSDTETIVPIKGSRSYEPISELKVSAPESAEDLNETINYYLGDMFGANSYEDYENYDYSYEDIEWAEEIENVEDVAEVEEPVVESEDVPVE